MNIFLLAVTSIAMSVAAQFCLKAGMTAIRAVGPVDGSSGLQNLMPFVTNRFLIGGFVLYGLGAVVWLAVLSKWDVSKAYPMVGLGFLLTAAVGFMLGEQVTAFRAMGVILIVAGVGMVAAS